MIALIRTKFVLLSSKATSMSGQWEGLIRQGKKEETNSNKSYVLYNLFIGTEHVSLCILLYLTVDFQLVVQKLRRESAHVHTLASILNRKFCTCANSRHNLSTVAHSACMSAKANMERTWKIQPCPHNLRSCKEMEIPEQVKQEANSTLARFLSMP